MSTAKKTATTVRTFQACIEELPNQEKRARNGEIYRVLKTDKDYTDVKFDRKSGGVKASHHEHNFDDRGGEYEKNAQNVGYKSGHAVIYESERHGDKYQRFTEGTWDGLRCEVAGTETGTDNNILRGLEHCADKRETEVAILVFPNGGFTPEKIRRAIGRYRGLEKLNDKEYVRFNRIVCIQNDEIIYDESF